MRTYLINGLFLYLLYAPGIIVKLGLRYVGFLKVLLSSAVNIIIMKLEGLHDAFLLVFQFHIQHNFKFYSWIGLGLFEKYQNPIFSINFRVRQLKLKIAKVNLK